MSRVFVRPDGNDENDGSSWELAKRTITNAINSAPDGAEILLGAGAYGTDPDEEFTDDDDIIVVGKSFSLKRYGGGHPRLKGWIHLVECEVTVDAVDFYRRLVVEKSTVKMSNVYCITIEVINSDATIVASTIFNTCISNSTCCMQHCCNTCGITCGNSRVVITNTAASWILIKDCSGVVAHCRADRIDLGRSNVVVYDNDIGFVSSTQGDRSLVVDKNLENIEVNDSTALFVTNKAVIWDSSDMPCDIIALRI